MGDYKIIRKKEVDFKPYQDKADEIFRRIYYKLGWTTLFRFEKAKELSLMYAMDIETKLTSTGCVVISKSVKKLEAVKRYWIGVYEAIHCIEKIK